MAKAQPSQNVRVMCHLSAICSPFRASTSLSPPSRPAHPLLGSLSPHLLCVAEKAIRAPSHLLIPTDRPTYPQKSRREAKRSFPSLSTRQYATRLLMNARVLVWASGDGGPYDGTSSCHAP